MTALLASAIDDLPVRLGRPEGVSWVAVGPLLHPGSPLLGERLRRFCERIAAPRRDVAASLLLEAWAGLIASVGFGSLLRGEVVPDLSAGSVSLRFPPGGVPDLVALHEPPEALDDGDGLAAPGPQDVQAAGPQEAGLGRLAEGLLGGHLGVLVARLRDLGVRRGPRALWGLVANGCAAGLVEASVAAQLPTERVRALVDAFFSLPGSPLTGRLGGPPRLLEVPTAGGTTLLRKRLTCCLSCTWAGCDPCASCPIFSDEQAVRLAVPRLETLQAATRR